MPIIRTQFPITSFDGLLPNDADNTDQAAYLTKHQGFIVTQPYPRARATNPSQGPTMQTHALIGSYHNAAGLAPGTFLKATDPTSFAFQAHGLTAADVGALPLAGTAANSSLLAGQAATYYTNASNLDAGLVPDARLKPYRLWTSDGASAPLTINASGFVGVNVPAPNAGLDVAQGSRTLSIGADASATTRTNAVNKAARVAMPHYAQPSADASIFYAGATSAENFIGLGGGTSSHYAATRLSFYTAANTTTATGTERLRISSTGTLNFYPFTSAGFLKCNASGLISGGNAIATGDVPDLSATYLPIAGGTLSGNLDLSTYALKAGATTRIASSGAATLGIITSQTYPVGRFRGVAAAWPEDDLCDGDIAISTSPSVKAGLYLESEPGWATWSITLPV